MGEVWTKPAVFETNFASLGPKQQGKVRDMYDLGDCLLLIASDRISAFDVVLPEGITGKGHVLTQLSKFWFEQLWQEDDLEPHHLMTKDPNKFPKSIVRGYLSGSAWKEYKKQGTVCEQPLPTGLQESDKFHAPLFTPSTKATKGHDENISYEKMKAIIGKSLAEQVKHVSLTLYQRATALSEERGIIIADTKFEFGLHRETKQLLVIDEILTPDSSRFWPKDQYEAGKSQPSFDKQYVRDYLDSIGWDHNPPPPHLPEDIVKQSSAKYREALERFI